MNLTLSLLNNHWKHLKRLFKSVEEALKTVESFSKIWKSWNEYNKTIVLYEKSPGKKANLVSCRFNPRQENNLEDTYSYR